MWCSRFMAVFVSVKKDGDKEEETKTKKLSQFLKSHILRTLEAIPLKFDMWSTDVGGSVQAKIVLFRKGSTATEVRKLHFLSSCQYTHGCCILASWPHDTLLCVLIYIYIFYILSACLLMENELSLFHICAIELCVFVYVW